MTFLKKYWHLILVSLLTVILGILTLLTTQRLKETKPIAPTVPQATPMAAQPACQLTFQIFQGTPTATPTVTPTVTSAPNANPDCDSLSVRPDSGSSVPLTVTLTCTGRDRDGKLLAAEFLFGDGSSKVVEKDVGSPGSLETSYNYNDFGAFTASCRVRDNNGIYSTIPDSCKKNITITKPIGGPPPTGTPRPTATPTPTKTPTPTPTTTPTPAAKPVVVASPSAQPTPKVPVAGSGPTVLGASVIAGGILFLLVGLLF